MDEFGFELALCAHLERTREWILGRQLGAAVRGRRVIDVAAVEPGPAFDARAAITDRTIPAPAVESDVGPGRARYWKDAFDCHPDRARAVVDRAVELGFFERERHNGREYVRQTVRYPDWFGRIVGVENKPDLTRPGDLETQLRTDVCLGLFDEVVLATESYVTGAHRNRIPDEVGIWRFHPGDGEREVVREPTPLSPDEPGVELVERGAARTDVRIVAPGEKARARRRLAERAYGKGWRTYEFPACSRVDPGADCLPHCEWHGRLVRPATECGSDCPGHDPAEPPARDAEAVRADRTPWRPDPDGRTRQQSSLDHFG
ncbi:hypothetical protein BRC83_03500 [Halobacteriales archaeon QS_1_68_17]|nr:MAG: hypothetical protein BRC83_03500 [Halobacteriales archaeon QS_1_68_17]